MAFLMLVLTMVVYSLATLSVGNALCPPGFVPGNAGCVCRERAHETVKCDRASNKSMLLLGMCMTYDNATGTTWLGACPYTIHHHIKDHVYLELPNDTLQLNSFMCGQLHRHGLLCGRCKQGYSSAVSSIGFKCAECTNNQYWSWMVYLIVEFLPITLLYVAVVVFHIRATLPPLNGYIFYCQMISTVLRANIPLRTLLTYHNQKLSTIAIQIGLAFTGIWTLDFLRYIIPPICIVSTFKNIHALMFGYLAALYAFCCILLTWGLIILHDRNFKPVVCLWKPLRKCLIRFRRNWDSKVSTANAFATFLLLSYSRITSTSFSLLHCGHVTNISSESSEVIRVLLDDPTVTYFSKEHLPYAVTAVIVTLVFLISPVMLLIFYPIKAFRRCFMCCGLRVWHTLHAYVEIFQGCYKDGTNGTRDYRFMSAIYMVLRLTIAIPYSVAGNTLTYGSQTLLLPFIVAGGAALLFATARPYKVTSMNVLESLLLAWLTLMSLLAYMLSDTENLEVLSFAVIILATVPQVVFTTCIIAKILKGLKCVCLKHMRNSGIVSSTNTSLHLSNEFADRVLNPHLYAPIPGSSTHTTDDSQGSEIPSNQTRRELPSCKYGSTNKNYQQIVPV